MVFQAFFVLVQVALLVGLATYMIVVDYKPLDYKQRRLLSVILLAVITDALMVSVEKMCLWRKRSRLQDDI